MDRDFEAYSDEELIRLLREKKTDPTDYLLEKYKGLVRNRARTMYLPGADLEDLIQEGMIGLFKAVRDYRPDRDASFPTFAALCVTRQMHTAVQAYARKKHLPLNTSLSLDDQIGLEDGKKTPLEGRIGQDPSPGPEELIIDRENVIALERQIEEKLSPFEGQVLRLHLEGLSVGQIAARLGKTCKSTENALTRARKKLKTGKMSRSQRKSDA